MSSVEWPALVWNPTRRAPALEAHGVHVWRTTLQPDAEAVAALGGILNAEERARAARYVRTRDRDAFVVARGTLRRILGSYLALGPQALELATTSSESRISATEDTLPCTSTFPIRAPSPSMLSASIGRSGSTWSRFARG